jgi:L-threonylcarbamoyladenylate synthase
VAEIEKVLGMPLDIATRPDNLHATGMVAPQYSPDTPLEVLTAPDLWLRVSELTARGLKTAVMGINQNDMKHTEFSNLRYEAMPPRAADYAQKLYATLRALDSDGFHCILAETPPDNSEWLAVRDRLAHVADISRKN